MLFNIQYIPFDEIHIEKKDIKLFVARLDKIHPVVSGNKLFKLHYFLEDAIACPHKTMLTFGGAFSNHLAAAAFACKEAGIKSIGIVRGERPENLSHTLQLCVQHGMELKFISREEYKNADSPDFLNRLKNIYGSFTLVPEGGYHPKGAAGAALIMNLLLPKNATHICTATGTGTTLAGLLLNAAKDQQVIAVPVLKNMTDIPERLLYLTGNKEYHNLTIFDEYHFGRYAKKTSELLNFMNSFYAENAVPTDFVYTAKMLYGIMDKINNDYFPTGSNIVCLHTGGLQGNNSLPENTLIY